MTGYIMLVDGIIDFRENELTALGSPPVQVRVWGLPTWASVGHLPNWTVPVAAANAMRQERTARIELKSCILMVYSNWVDWIGRGGRVVKNISMESEMPRSSRGKSVNLKV